MLLSMGKPAGHPLCRCCVQALAPAVPRRAVDGDVHPPWRSHGKPAASPVATPLGRAEYRATLPARAGRCLGKGGFRSAAQEAAVTSKDLRDRARRPPHLSKPRALRGPGRCQGQSGAAGGPAGHSHCRAQRWLLPGHEFRGSHPANPSRFSERCLLDVARSAGKLSLQVRLRSRGSTPAASRFPVCRRRAEMLAQTVATPQRGWTFLGDFCSPVCADAFLLQLGAWSSCICLRCFLPSGLEGRLPNRCRLAGISGGPADISHHLHQCKKHLRLPRHNGQLGPAAFRVLLRFDVGLGSLEELESGFQLQRLEVLLSQVSVPGEHDAQVPAVDEPLPAGLERSSSRNCFLVDGNSLRSENLPPRGGTVVGSPSTLLNQAGTKEALHVNLAELKELKVELLQFDEQTQFDVKEFRRRIAEADKELLGLLRSSAEFRMEVEDAESAWKNKQAYRKALMDAVQVAVDSARPSEPMEAAPQELVADCREKLQRLQIEILEDERRRQARLAEFNELCEDIAELKEVKQRSMLQLQSFLELRDQQRQGRLKNAVAQLMPLAPVDLNRFLDAVF
ncbi:unnamed protein product [Symbiodinium microadriaticum]|nr:unnamed protein product [Symbiodinium microadriaticum]